MLARKRLGLVLCGALGVGIIAALAAHAGLATVYGALDRVGWFGLAWVCVLQLVAMAFCAAAWKSVAEDTRFLSCLAARFIRSGVSNLAGIIPAIGEVAGARALSLLGAPAGIAAASTVVDVALEALSQGIYTMIGLIPLVFVVHGDELARWLGAVAVAIAPIFAVFLVIRRRGALMAAERIIVRIARMLGFSDAGANLDLTRNVLDIYQRRRRLWLALLLHLAGWFMSAFQLWAAAQALDRPLSPGEALALQSVAYAARGAFFFVPGGFGVQEGTFVLVGVVLGVDTASALALSLILRARDLVLGLPAIMLWYTAEGRRRWQLVRVPTSKA
ncbi:MAG: flippase-like domain-containing protein [Hyphomicrobiales bacterium]|nr:flippase-like domain-containing protein [Hyphomicrobiales bacterium]MBV9426783.1 flippase-like domain-containing protein [Bradyrhizobiaceae bacterium]